MRDGSGEDRRGGFIVQLEREISRLSELERSLPEDIAPVVREAIATLEQAHSVARETSRVG